MTGAGADLFKGSDRFTVTRRIGQGGMGVVYEAHDRLRQMPVAVKTIESGDPTALYRFKREFRSLSNIKFLGINEGKKINEQLEAFDASNKQLVLDDIIFDKAGDSTL